MTIYFQMLIFLGEILKSSVKDILCEMHTILELHFHEPLQDESAKLHIKISGTNINGNIFYIARLMTSSGC